MVQVDVTDSMVRIQGHAETRHHGNNVPCGQVSILGLSFAQGLHEITHQPDKVLRLEKGYFHFSREGLTPESDLLCRSLIKGLEFLSEAYPDKIRVTKL